MSYFEGTSMRQPYTTGRATFAGRNFDNCQENDKAGKQKTRPTVFAIRRPGSIMFQPDKIQG